jgi:hypothetical protein
VDNRCIYRLSGNEGVKEMDINENESLKNCAGYSSGHYTNCCGDPITIKERELEGKTIQIGGKLHKVKDDGQIVGIGII